MERVERRAQ